MEVITLKRSKRKEVTHKGDVECNSASEMCSCSSSKNRAQNTQPSRSCGDRCSKTKSKPTSK